MHKSILLTIRDNNKYVLDIQSGIFECAKTSKLCNVSKSSTIFAVMLMCTVVLMATLTVSSVYAASVDLRYAVDFEHDGENNPTSLDYQSTQMNITDAELGSPFAFLDLSVTFEQGASTKDTELRLLLSDAVFDPIFDTGSTIQIETDAHDIFTISSRNLIISELPVGIETIGILVGKSSDVVDGADSVDMPDADMDKPESEDVVVAQEPEISDETTSDTIDNSPNPADSIDESPTDSSADFDDLPPPPPPPPPTLPSTSDTTTTTTSKCGPGTVLVDGVCVLESDAPQLDTSDTTTTSKCGPGTVLVDGVCVLESDAPQSATSNTTDSKCGPGTVLVDNLCVLDTSDSSSSDPVPDTKSPPTPVDTKINGRDLITGVVAGFVIAGVVGVILALMYRADRTKKPQSS